jgi:hypothetical protein
VSSVLGFDYHLLNAFDLLPVKFESLPSAAVIEFVPSFNIEVVKVAVPPLNVPVPRTVLPLVNGTVSPFGGAGPTTAVNVTASS